MEPRQQQRRGQRQLPTCHVAEASGTGSARETEPSMATSRNVVVAVDASEDSVCAFQWTLRNLYRAGDSLHLLHVVPDVFSSPASGAIYYPSMPDPEVERALWQQAEDFITETFVGAAAAQGVAVNVILVKESAHKTVGWAVCRKAEELHAAPLVLATHHKSAWEEMLLGSVSKFCAAHCRQPVLLLHPEHSNLDV